MTNSKARTLTYAAAAAAVVTLAAGCGSSSSAGTSSGSQSVSAGSSGGSSSVLTTHTSSLGTVVADSSGKTIYELVGDPASNSKCSSSCQAIWPPVMSGGKIKTLHGHPLFTFSGDSGAGQTHGQGLTDTWGKWLALDSNGAAISSGSSAPATTPTPTQSSGSGSSSGGSGGYGY